MPPQVTEPVVLGIGRRTEKVFHKCETKYAIYFLCTMGIKPFGRLLSASQVLKPFGSPLPSLYLNLLTCKTIFAIMQSFPKRSPLDSSKDFSVDLQVLAIVSRGWRWQFSWFKDLFHASLTFFMIAWLDHSWYWIYFQLFVSFKIQTPRGENQNKPLQGYRLMGQCDHGNHQLFHLAVH